MKKIVLTGIWVLSILLISFRGSVSAEDPQISNISPGNQYIGGSVTITSTGENFSAQGNSVIFTSEVIANISTEDQTSITCTVPVGASSGFVKVKNSSGTPSEGVNFTIKNPFLERITPNTGDVSEEVVLEGEGFSTTPNNNIVWFTASGGGTVEASIRQATFTMLRVEVPENAVSGDVNVTVYGNSSGSVTFIVPGTSSIISSVNPSSGEQGDTLDITITGQDINWNDNSQVSFSSSDISVNSQTVNSAIEIAVNITISSDAPSGAGNVIVTTDDSSISKSNGFTIGEVVVPTMSEWGFIFLIIFLMVPANLRLRFCKIGV